MTMLDDAPDTRVDLDEVDGDDGGDDHGDGPTGRPDRQPRDRWWTNLPTLVVIALAWLLVAGGVVLWQQNQSLADDRDDRRDAARVAGDFATAVLSYDHRDLGGSLDRVLALATPEWGRQYEDAWFQDQQGVVEELRARARVDVRDVMVGDEQDDVLPAVVVFNATIRSQIGVRRLGGSYLRVDLTRVDGAWRVADMAFLASTEQSLDPAAGDGQAPPTGG